jgi:hypothetical protein
MAQTVNLDAMIARADFAVQDADSGGFENVTSISLRDFVPPALIGPNLRKPDFQRETNHWSPEQVVSLLKCYANGDLIPSVILWRSSQYLFVIDGGHRLSVLRAWVEDDYGDGPVSQAFFGCEISGEQRRIAARTRTMVNGVLGSWQHFQARSSATDAAPDERRRITALVSRALPIQWVTGNADKAESSFFRINTEGTPLDEIEELLLRNRRRPIAVAARAVIRAAKGHRYWSSFSPPVVEGIEKQARQLHELLFEPELQRPVKTLDLPLGGSKGVRAALQVLIDFLLSATQDQAGEPKKVDDQPEDQDGSATRDCLHRGLRLARRITGNDGGSLGLHPAVYFYGPNGRHSTAMFMGTVGLIGRQLSNNNGGFFRVFTRVRAALEAALVQHKDLIATILQKHSSRRRNGAYQMLLGAMIDSIDGGEAMSEQWLVDHSGLRGKVVAGSLGAPSTQFSDDAKSEVFITVALRSAIRCNECGGYLDPDKSLSYDHIERVRDGGSGDAENGQLLHPYCNQAVRS